MAPPGGGKRKRGDRSWSGDNSHDGQRPSPHRPGNLYLAQHNQGQPSNYGREQSENRGRGGRRPSRGGRGTANPQSPTSNRNSMNAPTSKPVSPPAQRVTDPIPAPQSNGVQHTLTIENAAIPSTSETLPDPRPFDYSYITDGVCETWESSGRLSVTEKGRKLRDEEDSVELGTFFQELLLAGMSGRTPPSEAGGVIKDIAWPGPLASDTGMNTDSELSTNLSDSQVVFLDTMSVFFAETPISPQAFSAVLQSSGVPPVILRQELDIKFLEKLGLIRTTFGRMAVRKTTNVLYRQANFNLLREESEGFAKLITELFTTSGNEPPTAEVVEDTVERVKAMIGSFDLDVGRALDVVLDVFGAVLVKQFRFFVKFLRASPWWPRGEDGRHSRKDTARLGGLPQWALPGFTAWHLDDSQRADLSRLTEERDRLFWVRARDVGLQAFYEIGRERVADTETKKALPAANTESTEPSAKEKFMQDWVKQTGTLPPGGNEDAAQLLGFKLRFYSSSVARTENDTLPDNLIYLSALLIKVGFISLKDLYNHIWRTDGDMETLRQEKVKEKAERERASRPGQGAKNALLMAGALADDTMPIPARFRDTGTRAGTPSKEADSGKVTPSTEKKDALPEPADQKVPLLRSLLAIGAIPESLFILGKFPWIVDLYPELPEYINRIIHHALSKIYGSIKPVASDSTLQHQKPSSDSDIAALLKGQIRLVQAHPRKVLRWALLDRDDSGTDGLDYRFYWDEWSDSIPVCQSVDDLFILCDTFVNLTGIKIGHDPALLVKLARIGKYSIAQDKSESNLQRWSDLCKRLLVPALSLTKSIPGVVNEVFELLSNFSIETRYLIYQEWSGGRTSKTSDMKTASDQAKAETRDTLKRLSRTNVRPMARALAKIAYSNPHIVINTAISQIEVYDNLAEVFVEGARYFTDLGYDVLTWSLISALGRAGRSRVQESGLVTSRWLTALAYFAGKMFKRYTIMRPGPVLEYVTDQLIKGNPTDLIVLEQIILFMAGIVTDASYNDTQLLAMGGGELLRSQTILQLLDKRHESRITSRRLMRSLKESDLAGKLLLAIAVQRQASVFNLEDTNAPLKLLGNLYDEIQRVLTQYLDLLHSNLSPEEYESAVPDVSQLIVGYKVQPEVAFWISRPTLRRRIAESDKAMHNNGAQKKTEDLMAKDLGNGDVDMADQLDGVGEDEGEALETEPVIESAATPTAAEIDGVVSNPGSPEKPSSEEIATSDEQSQHWHPVLQPIMESIKSSLPAEVSNVIGLGFYVTFWQLAVYDVTIPGKSYEDELSRQHKRIATISSNRADVTAAGARKREAEKKQISNLIDRLLTENKEHLKAFAEGKARLSKEKGNWFVGMHNKSEVLLLALMEHCFLPRILLSPLDSLFSFKFLKFLHTSGTTNFRTMRFYDLIFRQNRLTSLIFMCTSKEADNLGRFLHEILRDLARWHKDRTLYEREAWGSKKTLPGFAKKVSRAGKPETFLHYEDFRRLLYKWHQHMIGALQACLSSTEYMHIRNAISVLKAVAETFPALNFHGNQLQRLISALGLSEQGDIKVPSLSLMADLNKAEKSWILPQAFRKGQEKVSEGSTITPKASTPVPAGQPLNAEATEFKPSPSSGADLSSEQEPGIKANADDNEARDTQMTEAGPTEVGLTDISKSEIKEEDTEKPKMPSVPPESNVEATTISATVQQDPRLSGSSTPSTIPMPSGEMRQQDGNSKLGTPQPRGVPRPDSASSPLQPHPNLPHRPERPEPRHMRPNDARVPNRSPAHAESPRDFRDNRSHDRAPPDRHGGNHQAAAQYPSPHSRPHQRRSERMESDLERGDRARSQERDTGSKYPPQDRRNQPPFHENGTLPRESERSGRARAPPDSPRNRTEQERRQQERLAQENHMAPPRGPHSTIAEATNINPERAALISGGASNGNGISIRGQGEERPARGSRPTSPKRDFDSRHPPRQERPEDRAESSDRRPGDFDSRQRDRHNASFGNGPRTHHSDRPNRSGESFPRDIRHQPPQQYPPVDMNHGRLNQDDRPPSRHHEQSSDRSDPPNEVPSGPRSRNPPSTSRGRNAHPPQPQVVTQRSPSNIVQQSMGAPDRPAPTGPASRSHTRGQSFQEQPNNSVPGAPADTSGVHPDRLALVSPSAEGPPQRMPSYPSKPSPVQTSPTSVPSGPRGNAPSGAPSGPAPITRGPPSGPQGNGRNNRHPLAAVNSTLQQAGQGQSIRGRGGNRTSNGPSTPHSGPSTSIPGQSQGPRSEVTMPSSQEQGRPDLFSSRGDQDTIGRRPPPQRRDDLAPDRPPPTGRRSDLIDEASDSGRRSSRHSGGSRNHSPDGDGSGRRNERGQVSHRDQEIYRSERDGEGRDHGRDRHGDSGRDRRGGGGGDAPDRPPREPSSRQPAREDDHQLPPPLAPPRRSSRRDVPSAVDLSPSNIPPPPPGPSSQGQGSPHDDRGRRRGYQSGPRPPRGDGRDHQRGGGGEREMRETRGPGRDLRGPGPTDAGDLPPRKHPRAEEGAPYSGGGGGGGRGGNRMASESKRPRRGG